MAGYQFMHMECYAKTSRKGSGNSGKTGDGRTADEVIAEAIREAGNAPHVKNPRKPHIADTCRAGYGFKDLKVDYEAACNAQVKMTNGKTRKNRSTALTLATMVCTYPIPVAELKTPEQKRDYQRWRKRAIQYARSEFGDDYRMAVQHLDERFPHLHFFAIAKDAARLHPGLSAAKDAEKAGKTGGDLGKAAAEGLRAAQDRYYQMVGQPEGQARLGPKRLRQTRAQWRAMQFANDKTAEMLNYPRKLQAEADARAARQWSKKSLFSKLRAAPKLVKKADVDDIKNAARIAAEKAASQDIARAEGAASKAISESTAAKEDARAAKAEAVRDRKRADTAEKSARGVSDKFDALDSLLEYAIPHLAKEHQEYIRDGLAEHAPDTKAMETAVSCAPNHASDQIINHDDDESTRNLKQATNAANAAARRGPGGM